MKRVVLATALACAAMAASADVTVYGRLDNGLMYDHAADSLSMESGIAGASRIGFKGTEKVSDNLKVGFVLESKITTDNGGGLGGFDREAAIYVYTPYGDLRVGRSGALGGGSNGGIFGGVASPFGTVYKNAASTVIHAQEERFDNQVRYDSPVFGGLKLMAQYANGNGDDTARLDRYAAIGANYKAGNLNVVAVYDRVFDKNEGDLDQQYAKVAAQYKLDNVTLVAGYQHGKDGKVAKVGKANLLSHGDSDSVTLGASVGVAGGKLNMVYGYVKGEEAGKEAEAVQAAVGYTYALTKRTTLYVAGTYLDYEVSDNGDVTDSGTNKQVLAGLYHTF